LSRDEAIVIGAGPNGLTAGALLAREGFSVTILEAQSEVGGSARSEEFHPGYWTGGLLHDTSGLRPAVIDELELEKHGLELGGPPDMFVPTVDGRGLLVAHDAQQAIAEIQQHSAGDAERYVEFRAFFDRVRGFAARVLDGMPPDVLADPSAGELLGPAWALRRLGRKDMMEVLRLGPMCAADWLNEWFEGELLKCALAQPALLGTFMGPWSPGSNTNLLRHEALTGRAAQRGPHAVVAALVAAATSQGARIRTAAKVMRIKVHHGAVTGVVLADGEELDATTVVATCHPVSTFLRLVDGAGRPPGIERALRAFRSKGCTAKVHLALDTPLRFACRPDLPITHARLGERMDDLERAFDVAKYGGFSTQPILDVHVASERDPSLAPAGHAAVSMLVSYAPYDLEGGWTDDRRQALGDAAVAVLGRHAPGVKSHIVARQILTPVDLEAIYGLPGGHLYHGDHALDQLIVRPAPGSGRFRTPVDGLWLGGSGSHPGGGITGGPGRLAARAVGSA
jgi:phytoene dehydrogenase-like protein